MGDREVPAHKDPAGLAARPCPALAVSSIACSRPTFGEIHLDPIQLLVSV